MASLTNLPKKFASGHQIRPRSANRVNPIKAIQDREWRRKQMEAAAAQSTRAGSVLGSDAGGSPPPPRARASARLQCPNKACKNPNVVDGTCRTCGRVADDSNIVAEVSFGENAQGAAVVQGSFLSHDQGGVRTMAGIGHRRVAGNGSAEARERTLREARLLMTGYAHQLNIPEHTVTVGFQYYKLASSANFVQGRKIQNVVAVCLYAACRKSTHANPCKIMLIDLADLVKEEVFFLGRTFKKLLQTIDVAARDVQPIYVEDLIFRFAAKLEFDTMTNKVAETAVRLVQRMDRDWMVMGRRPAGICGACLIMAARMYNFRRTVREVVYIAKVTMATLQMRLDEFKELPSAKMTVEEFLAQDFLSEEHDPPSIYKKSEQYQARLREKRQTLKRKRGDTPATPAAVRVDSDGFVVPPLPSNSATSTPTPTARTTRTTRAASRRASSADQGIIDQALETNGEGPDAQLDQLEALAEAYGDDASASGQADGLIDGAGEACGTPTLSDTGSPSPAGGAVKRRRRRPDGSSCRTLPISSNSGREEPDYVDDEWRADEENLEMEMTEAINSPGCLEHARAFASAEKHAQMLVQELAAAAAAAAQSRTGSSVNSVVSGASGASGNNGKEGDRGEQGENGENGENSKDGEDGENGEGDEDDKGEKGEKKDSVSTGMISTVSDKPEVDEDEFKDDPEVQFCLLSEEEAAAKEKIWMNENRAYLRMRQEREFRAKMAAASGAKKQTRRRLKKPKIGEGQTSPASTPGEAAVEAMERRGFSKRINYDAMRRMLDRPAGSGGAQSSRAGSVSIFSGYTSRAGSSVGSVLGDAEEEEEEEEEEVEEEGGYEEDVGGEEEYMDDDVEEYE